MSLIVQKFGGTSVADTSRIIEVTKIIKKELDAGNQVIVIVSAMAGVTSNLINYCNDVSKLNNQQKLIEYDCAVASGEQITAALTALALQEIGIESRSFLGWQLNLETNSNHSKALVNSVDSRVLQGSISKGEVPVIAGFQGITTDYRLSTLGRGGSDTTAAIIAAAMNADLCDIYTDVEGVFSADPRIVHSAKQLNVISYDEMLEFASAGAKVIHPRAVEISKRYNIPLRVLSAFTLKAGTLITKRNETMENRIVTGITSNKSIIQIYIIKSKLKLDEICNLIVRNNTHVESILTAGESLIFIASISDKPIFEKLLDEIKNNDGIKEYSINTEIAEVSLIGVGIKNDLSLTKIVIDMLTREKIEILSLQKTDIKLSILLNIVDTEKAIKLLHSSLISA